MEEMRRSLTLIEMIIVVVVVSVLASFAVPSYWGARQNTMRREGAAVLVLIQSGEKVKNLELGAFQACATSAACNTALDLDIPAGSFTYSAVLTAGGVCAQATAAVTGATTQSICATGGVFAGACPGAC
jgi:prepilin-type N-terminal cleavage/methylation domain-containing protein